MEPQLKPISKSGVPAALSKAELYRNLNEPGEAESICRDILATEPDNQSALRLLGLAITDQFTGGTADRYPELAAGRLPHTVLPVFEEAMRCFEEAEKIRPPENDDAILRWNRCVRLLQSRPEWHKEMEEFDAGEGPPV